MITLSAPITTPLEHLTFWNLVKKSIKGHITYRHLLGLIIAMMVSGVSFAQSTNEGTNVEQLEQHKQLVTTYIEQVWNQKQHDTIDQFIAEDLIQHNHNLPNGREPLREFLGSFASQNPDAKFEIKRVIAEGDLVVTHSYFKPTPDALGVIVVDIFRVENGLIVEHWDVMANVPEEESANGNTVY